jgi:hypothetical protein
VDRPLKLKPSSHIHGGTYDPQTGRLTLVLNGGTIAHHGVSVEHAEGLEKAASHGKYYHENIRNNPDYDFSRVR